MATQTPVTERTIRASLHGTGRDHYHVILSKSRGLDRVIAVSTFDHYIEAGHRAQLVKAEYERMGFKARTYDAGTYLELSKVGETPAFVTTRHCRLRHTIDG
jgi:hypothetical protein